MNTQVLGISVDHVPCLKAWADSFNGINYPLLSDFWPHGEVAKKYGVLRHEGKSERAIFIIDKDGIIRYIDIHDIDDQPSNEVLFKELSRITGLPVPPETEWEKDISGLPHGGVVMYCTSWCPDCKRARIWLKERNIPYTEVDISITAGAAWQVRQWTHGLNSTPTFDIDGTIVVDFQPDRLREILGIRD